ncbi:MAG: SDR family NAD(P)-dependent oxidoreductase [Phaeodactylibacter sp.]|nr:SDR family NAD(P)-dependent oxidoreductase [Phaeodactylibacter sp.]
MSFFKDKVVIVTGSTQGIGKSIAQKLVERGAKVTINGRNGQKLEQTQGLLTGIGHEVLPVQGDISLMEDCQRLVEATLEQHGRVDILITNAGINMLGKVAESDPEYLKKVMDVNFFGCLFPFKAAFDALKASEGNFLMVGSIAGFHGLPMNTMYSASKMALTALAQGLRTELAPHNITVGHAYVGMTEVEPGKTVLDTQGNPVPKPKFQIKPEPIENVSTRILKMVEKGTFQQVFTPMGKVNYVMSRLFPSVVQAVLKRNFKRVEEDVEGEK